MVHRRRVLQHRERDPLLLVLGHRPDGIGEQAGAELGIDPGARHDPGSEGRARAVAGRRVRDGPDLTRWTSARVDLCVNCLLRRGPGESSNSGPSCVAESPVLAGELSGAACTAGQARPEGAGTRLPAAVALSAAMTIRAGTQLSGPDRRRARRRRVSGPQPGAAPSAHQTARGWRLQTGSPALHRLVVTDVRYSHSPSVLPFVYCHRYFGRPDRDHRWQATSAICRSRRRRRRAGLRFPRGPTTVMWRGGQAAPDPGGINARMA